MDFVNFMQFTKSIPYVFEQNHGVHPWKIQEDYARLATVVIWSSILPFEGPDTLTLELEIS